MISLFCAIYCFLCFLLISSKIDVCCFCTESAQNFTTSFLMMHFHYYLLLSPVYCIYMIFIEMTITSFRTWATNTKIKLDVIIEKKIHTKIDINYENTYVVLSHFRHVSVLEFL